MKKIFYFLLIIIAVAGCRPVKKVQNIEQVVAKKDSAETVIVNPEKEKVDSFSIVKSIISNLQNSRINFTTFSGKIKIDYQGKDAADQATAYIRVRKDSVIWISLTGALGIEGYRLLINKDSVKMMNKLQKVIQYKTISYLQELTEVPFDFYSLQDLIVGNPIFVDSNIVSYKANDNELLILMVGNVFKHLISLETNQDFRVSHSKLDDLDAMRNRTCDITYESYEYTGNFYFSTKRRVTVSEKSKFDVDVEFKNYIFDKPQDYPFSIPKNYKRK